MNRSFAEVAITCHTDSVCVKVGNVIQTHAFVQTALHLSPSANNILHIWANKSKVQIAFHCYQRKDFHKRALHITHKGNIALMQKAFCLWLGLRHHIISQAPQKTKGSSKAMWTHYFHNLHGIVSEIDTFCSSFSQQKFKYCTLWHLLRLQMTHNCCHNYISMFSLKFWTGNLFTRL